MESLKDLAYLLNRYTIRDIEVLTNSQTSTKKHSQRYWDFYIGLQKGKWKTEDEIAQHFGYASKTDKGYRRLKEGLKDRLLNSLFFVDLDGSWANDEVRKKQEASRLVLLSEHILHLGSSHFFYEIAEKALALAQEVEHTALILHACTNLRTGYACRPKYAKDYSRVDALYEKYWQQMQREVQVQRDLDLLNASICNHNRPKQSSCMVAIQQYEQYRASFATCDGFKFRIYTYMLGVNAAFMAQQWAMCLSICNEALQSAEINHQQKGKPYISTFISHKSACLLMLKQYKASNACLTEGLAFVEEGKNAWFKNREIAAIGYLHSEQYQTAWDLVGSALNHPRFKGLPELDQETWRLYQGYLYLIGRIRTEQYWPENDTQAAKFRMSKWINNMPFYSQDKRGKNIPLLILQVLFLFTEVQYNPEAFEEMSRRIEALRKYAGRNLEWGNEHHRTNSFIALLQLLPKYASRPQELQHIGSVQWRKLQGTDNIVWASAFEIEVVPYERQWLWITALAESAQVLRDNTKVKSGICCH